MDEHLKKRLIGALVLISLAVIFLPMLLEHEPIQLERAYMPPIPPEPARSFNQELLASNDIKGDEETSETVQAQRTAGTAIPPDKVSNQDKTEQSEKTQIDAAKPHGWIIQVGSYANRTNAESLVKKLRKNGLDTLEVQAVQMEGKTLYRVRVGPEISRGNAEKLLPRVTKISGAKAKVLKYP